jgi:hypothetical protein
MRNLNDTNGASQILLDIASKTLEEFKDNLIGIEMVESKLTKGAYLCLHDVIPYGHIAGLNEWYEQIKLSNKYELIGEFPNSYLAILKKK